MWADQSGMRRQKSTSSQRSRVLPWPRCLWLDRQTLMHLSMHTHFNFLQSHFWTGTDTDTQTHRHTDTTVTADRAGPTLTAVVRPLCLLQEHHHQQTSRHPPTRSHKAPHSWSLSLVSHRFSFILCLLWRDVLVHVSFQEQICSSVRYNLRSTAEIWTTRRTIHVAVANVTANLVPTQGWVFLNWNDEYRRTRTRLWNHLFLQEESPLLGVPQESATGELKSQWNNMYLRETRRRRIQEETFVFRSFDE